MSSRFASWRRFLKRNPTGRKASYRPQLDELEVRELLTASLAVGQDAGGQPRIKVFNAATGQQTMNFLAFEGNFNGGVRVAMDRAAARKCASSTVLAARL